MNENDVFFKTFYNKHKNQNFQPYLISGRRRVMRSRAEQHRIQ